ncbi:MAG TPA: LysE family transporter [Azospirillum sp.]|nr:LysE family transporter [Azospirillum sp.]
MTSGAHSAAPRKKHFLKFPSDEHAMTSESFLQSIAFGLALSIAVGPIALIIINNGVNHGFFPALRSAAGAALADLTFALTAFLSGQAALTLLADRQDAVRGSASLALIAFGLWTAWSTAARMRRAQTDGWSRPTCYGFRATYILTIVNPLTVLTISAFAAQVTRSGDVAESLVLALGLSIGSLFVQAGYAAFSSLLRPLLTDRRLVDGLNLASAAGITLFGVLGFL